MKHQAARPVWRQSALCYVKTAPLEGRSQLGEREKLLWCEHPGPLRLGAAQLEERLAEGKCRGRGDAVVAAPVDGTCGDAAVVS